jgi:hypothetical protein
MTPSENGSDHGAGPHGPDDREQIERMTAADCGAIASAPRPVVVHSRPPDSRSPEEWVAAEETLMGMLVRHYGWREHETGLKPPWCAPGLGRRTVQAIAPPRRDRISLGRQGDVAAVVVDFATGQRSIWLCSSGSWSSHYGPLELPEGLVLQEVIY